LAFDKFILKNQERVLIFVLLFVLAGILLVVDFYGYDPHIDTKTNYMFSQTGSRSSQDEDASHWNRNLNSGMPQYNKVFWDQYPEIYQLFSQPVFFIIIVFFASLGVYLFFLLTGYNRWESLFGAIFYGLAIRFLGYLPIWQYGWKLILLFIPWMAYSMRQLKNGASIRYAALFSLMFLLSLLLFETEIIIYLLLAIVIYLLYSFVDMIEYEHGMQCYINFLLKVMVGIFLAVTGVIFPYLPLLRGQNLSILDSIQSIAHWRLAMMIILIAGAFLLLRLGKKRIVLFAGTGLLIACGMYAIIYQFPWIDNLEIDNMQTSSELVQEMLSDNSEFRIYPIGKEFRKNRWAVKTQSIGGKDFYQPRHYNRIISQSLDSETDKNLNINWNLLKLLNVKYLISAVKIPSYRVDYAHYSPDEKLILYKLQETPKYAWFVENWQILYPEKIIQKLNEPEFDPYSIAFLEHEIPEFNEQQLPKPQNAKISIINIEQEYIELRVENENPGLLIISELFDRDWQAYVDEIPVEIYRADYLLRSIVVPPGPHEIAFRYEPDIEKYIRISYWARVLILLLLIEELLFFVWKRFGASWKLDGK